ncbi:MAG TPA: hypothetical protein VJK53_01710 [Candidatus Paceibacterota bacterium]
MKFDYREIGSRRKRPFIPIKIRNPKNSQAVECYALVDSGSDCNLFAPVLGEIIGMQVEMGIQRPVSGVVGGERRGYFEHLLEIEVGGWSFATTIGFMPGISSQAGEGVLGQTGFFDHFNFVKFDKRTHIIEIGSFIK